MGTGDFTHPGWTAELKEKLEPAEQGLFKLKKNFISSAELSLRNCDCSTVRFILTAEISCIYKKNGKVRKVHHLIISPDFETVEKIQSALKKIGNITSDGRPILGLDSKNLLEIILNISEQNIFIPAHIWTPWFSALGSKSGFDSIDECFDELTKYIFAIETGLSSDPYMNWMCSFLDKFTIISNSDAHSPEKLGREANLFDTELSYTSIRDALKHSDSKKFLATIEFFPHEGKYHFDGHRNCNICWNPVETIKNSFICPVCKKKITVGVMYRVAELADRENILERKNRHNFYSLVPLIELVSEIFQAGTNSKKVESYYFKLLNKFGTEFNILLNASCAELENKESPILAEAVRRMRQGKVNIIPGYDGKYGKISVFKNDELKNQFKNKFLFSPDESVNEVSQRA